MGDLSIYNCIQLAATLFGVVRFVFIVGLVYSSFLVGAIFVRVLHQDDPYLQ